MVNPSLLQRYSSRAFDFLTSRYFHIILITVGVYLRLNHYLENRPLWLDETYVATQILCRSWREVLSFYHLLPDQPQAPLFFYVIVKGTAEILGNYEYTLRLLSLVCGTGSIFLFYRLLHKHFEKGVVTLALGLFVFCDRLVYYAAELKYYSLDLLVALVLLYFFEQDIKQKEFGCKEWLRWSILGVLSPWFSYGSLFVLSGMGLTFLIYHFKPFRKSFCLIGTFLLWLASFGLLISKSLDAMATNNRLLTMWSYYKFAFLPYPVTFSSFVIWLKDVFLHLFVNPVGISFPVIGLIVFIVGFAAAFFKNPRRVYVYGACLLSLLTAAILTKYPFYGRMLVFFVPVVFILMAEGLMALMRGGNLFKKGIGVIVIILLFSKPLSDAWFYLGHKRYQEDSRVVLKYFKKKYRPGDFIFFNNYAFLQLCYYLKQLEIIDLIPKHPIKEKGEFLHAIDMARFTTTLVPEDEDPGLMEFDHFLFFVNTEGFYRGGTLLNLNYFYRQSSYQFPAKRTWVILITTPRNEKDFILSFFHNNGRLIDRCVSGRDGVYLFERANTP